MVEGLRPQEAQASAISYGRHAVRAGVGSESRSDATTAPSLEIKTTSMRGGPAGPGRATSSARSDIAREHPLEPNAETPLLDTYLSEYDVTEFHACVVSADANTTWDAIRHVDLSLFAGVRALLLLRAVPGRIKSLAGGQAPPPQPPFTLADMPRVGFELLDERPGEIVFGFVGRPWSIGAEKPLALGRDSFASFVDPGYAKIAFTIRAESYGAHRTLVTTETRTATTDPRSRHRFAVYWTLIGPFSALIRRAILRRLKSDVETARPPRRESRKVRIEGEILINRSVDKVFDFVADERNEPRYNPRLLRAEQTSPGPIGIGTQFRAETKAIGGAVPMTIEFTGFERPRRIALATRLSTMDIRGALTFDPISGRTRMRWSWVLEPRGLFKLMTPMLASIGRRQEQIVWDNLKRVMEAGELNSATAGS